MQDRWSDWRDAAVSGCHCDVTEVSCRDTWSLGGATCRSPWSPGSPCSPWSLSCRICNSCHCDRLACAPGSAHSACDPSRLSWSPVWSPPGHQQLSSPWAPSPPSPSPPSVSASSLSSMLRPNSFLSRSVRSSRGCSGGAGSGEEEGVLWPPGARLGDRELEAEFGRELVLWLLLFLLLATNRWNVKYNSHLLLQL